MPAVPSQRQNCARRDAGRPHHDEFAAAGEVAEPEQRADQRCHRQQLHQVRWQVQRDERHRLTRGVVADADVVLLADEEEECAER